MAETVTTQKAPHVCEVERHQKNAFPPGQTGRLIHLNGSN